MTCAGCLRHGLQRLGVRLEVTEAVLNHLRELGGGPVAALTLRPQARSLVGIWGKEFVVDRKVPK
jgi:hypothetical protein